MAEIIDDIESFIITLTATATVPETPASTATPGSLQWISDKYDRDGDRRINSAEVGPAYQDYRNGKITSSNYSAVATAQSRNTLLPVAAGSTPDTPPASTTLTPEILLWMRNKYDTNRDGYIDHAEWRLAEDDFYHANTISEDQIIAVTEAKEKHIPLPAWPAETGVAKGQITNLKVPRSGIHGKSAVISCEVRNTGTAVGTFVLEVVGGGVRVRTSAMTVRAGSVSTMRSMSFNLPTAGTSAAYKLNCIRLT